MKTARNPTFRAGPAGRGNHHLTALFIALAGVLSGLSGCDRASTKGVLDSPGNGSTVAWLVDRAAPCGLDFHHDSGHDADYVFPEIMGGGAAIFDIEEDGDLDVYLVQSGWIQEAGPRGGNRLYRNDGNAPDGSPRFVDITDSSGAGQDGYGMGVAAGDYDNDGDTDLYVTNVGANALLQNDGQGHFTDVTSSTGTGDPGWGTSAAFVDVDRDGWLDLYVCNYVVWSLDNDLRCENRAGQADYCHPNSYSAPQPDVLYRNNGDGTFRDVSVAYGLRRAFGNGLGVVCGDFNGDGRTDIFVANDSQNNQYWINQGEAFEDQALVLGCAVDKDGKAKAGMGTCAADIDGDDDLDLLVVNLQAQSDSFYRNEGAYFVDDTPVVGLGTSTRPFTRFGVGWVDFDNDGQLDLFQANGRVTLPDGETHGADPFAEPNKLLIGDGPTFRLAPVGTIPATSRTSRAAAFGDLNNDGAVDVVVVNRDASAELLMNEKGKTAHWLLVDARQRDGRPDVGAELRFRIGERHFRRDVNPHFSYLASNDPRVHVGLGPATEVATIEVRWVDGTRETFGPCSADQIVRLQQGTGTAVQP